MSRISFSCSILVVQSLTVCLHTGVRGKRAPLCVCVCNSEMIQKSAAKRQHSSTYYVSYLAVVCSLPWVRTVLELVKTFCVKQEK